VGDQLNKKILIVEDEALTLMELETCIKSWGYQSLTAFSGEEAISIAVNEEPDLIIMDIILSGKINGIKAAEEIKKEIEVPIVYLSAYNDEITRKEAEYTLPFNFIAKPFDNNLLKYAIEMALSRHEMEKRVLESEARFRVVFDSVPDQIFIKDKNSVYTMVNPALEQFFGIKSEELVGKTDSELFTPDHVEHILKIDQNVLKGEVIKEETPPVGQSKAILQVIKSPMYSSNGEIIGLCGIARDITQQKNDEEIIKKSLHEKEMLMREINHRVKNNLTVISSLLSLQSSYVADEEAKGMFKDSQNRARAMALIHERLYQSKDLKRIDFADYISTLAIDLFNTYQINQDRITLDLEIEETLLDVNTAIPLGLILNELISNSLNYAFSDGKHGKINISLKKTTENQFILEVFDNGIGIPQDFDIKNTNSFGLQIVSILIDQIQGALEIDNNGGTRFVILFEDFNKVEF
jgi:PAS domain S-box-containing protein